MPMVMTPAQQAWFQSMRGQWLDKMSPFSGYSPSALFPQLPIPSSDRLKNCKVLASREEILPFLPKGGVVAEVGTQEGIFAEKIVAACDPRELHLFDIDFGPLEARPRSVLHKRARKHIGDSSSLLSAFPDDAFDWIYIDGDHSYEGVCRDVEVARTKVKPGGYLVFNDFTLWSPVECIDYGVPYAVCALSRDHGWDFAFFALHPLMYCDVVLRRPLPQESK